MKGGIDVDRLFNNDSLYLNVPQIYVLDGERKNAVQFIAGETDVPIGIRSQAEGKVSLRFNNVESFHAESLVLLDKASNTSYSLLSGLNEIQFDNLPDLPDRFLLRVGKQTTDIRDNVNDAGIQVWLSGNKLYVEAGEIIQNITVANMQGVNIFSRSSLGSRSFSMEMNVPDGIYVVRVRLVNGEITNYKLRIMN